jgi:hypothetical protein
MKSYNHWKKYNHRNHQSLFGSNNQFCMQEGKKHGINVWRKLPKSIIEFSAGRKNIELMFQESTFQSQNWRWHPTFTERNTIGKDVELCFVWEFIHVLLFILMAFDVYEWSGKGSKMFIRQVCNVCIQAKVTFGYFIFSLVAVYPLNHCFVVNIEFPQVFLFVDLEVFCHWHEKLKCRR